MEESDRISLRKRDNRFMNLKSSLVFFSAGVILILFLFLMGAVPMGMLGTSQQQLQQEQQEQNNESNNDISSKGDDSQGQQQQLTTTMTTTTSSEAEEENSIIVPANTQAKPIDQMNCTELKEFAFSFEQGWGSAVALHDKKCS